MTTATCLKKPATIRLSRAELEEKIDRISGYPTVGCEMWLYICKKFIQFDKKHHPECFNSGIWINNGFSSYIELGDWEIDVSRCKITYI